MERRLTTFERRFEILILLIKYKKTTYHELSSIFNVCENTLANDILLLSHYAPIYTRNGINGGIFILESYKCDFFSYLTIEEETLLESLKQNLDEANRNRISTIINRYSMPKNATVST